MIGKKSVDRIRELATIRQSVETALYQMRLVDDGEWTADSESLVSIRDHLVREEDASANPNKMDWEFK